MKRSINIFFASFLLVLFSCTSAEGNSPKGGNTPVFAAREWDGEKRAEVFYEIFVRSFADSDGDGIGDLRGITDKLGYLDELGIGGIWLTPIFPSPSYHGYNVNDYTAVNPQFGTMADFERLIDKAHSLNIRVVLDFVLNHTGSEHPWFLDACSSLDSDHRDWYLFAPEDRVAEEIAVGSIPMTNVYSDWEWRGMPSGGTPGYKYMAMFDYTMPDVNYGPVETAEESSTFKAMCDAARFWLEKGVDGLRLDAVKHIYQSETSDENPRFLRKFHDELAKTKSDIYMIGEVLSEADVVAPYYAGLPALFDFDSWWKLEYAINNAHAKWYPKDLLDRCETYARYRPDFIQATKLSNHDETRTRTSLGGDIAKCKMAAAVLMTVSGSPYVYYGEEIGMPGLQKAGDLGMREPFLWGDNYRTSWQTPEYGTDATVESISSQINDPSSLWNVYSEFIRLRNTYPALAMGEMKLPQNFDGTDSNDKNFMVFTREADDERLLVIHNVSPQKKIYIIGEPFSEAIAEMGGVKVSRISNDSYVASMPGYSSLILELE